MEKSSTLKMSCTPFGEKTRMCSDLGEEEIRLVNGAPVSGVERTRCRSDSVGEKHLSPPT